MMLRSIFLKTIYEKRWMSLWWILSIVATTVMIVVLFPTFRDSFGESLKNVPESMQSWMGSASDYQNIVGYTDIQVVAQMIFMPVIMGIMLGSGLLAGDENNGTLQTLLYQPTKRSQIYLSKIGAASLLTLGASLSIIIGVYLGALFINEASGLPFIKLAYVTLAIWLVTMVFTTASYSIGAIFGQRGSAGMGVGLFAFITLIITSLATTGDFIKRVDYFSPFHYYNHPSILKDSMDWSNIVILLLINIITLTIGYLVFMRRDIYQR